MQQRINDQSQGHIESIRRFFADCEPISVNLKPSQIIELALASYQFDLDHIDEERIPYVVQQAVEVIGADV